MGESFAVQRNSCTQFALTLVVAPRVVALAPLYGRSLCIDVADFSCCVNKKWRSALYVLPRRSSARNAFTSLSVLAAPRRERQALRAPRP